MYLYAAGLFFSYALASICYHQFKIHCTNVGIRVIHLVIHMIQARAALMMLIYRKALKLGFVGSSISDVVNLLSNDCNHVAEAFIHYHFLWSAWMQAIGIFILLVIF